MSFRKLVEEWLPLKEINKSSENEQGFIRVPKISNLHPWPARRPYATARVLTLASILPSNFSRDLFYEIIGLNKVNNVPYKVLYLVQPDRKLIADIVKREVGRSPNDIIVVDPMAGGGTIPLESLRLGFKTIAIEYNPVAYLILKATLEYPAKYGMSLYNEVRTEAKKLINWASEELSKYYSKDAMNYIIARGYKCRSCGGLVPIIHSTKLGEKGPYIKFTFDKESKSFTVDISNIETEFERLRCPYCNSPVAENVALRDWISRHKKLLEIALSGDFKTAKESIEELIQTHILLIKQTEEGFTVASKEDVDRFIEAYLDLARLIEDLREFILEEPIPKENDVFKPVTELGLEYWYELFNPRQLLTLLKLLKYVSERCKGLIKEKGEYGTAIATYLAFGIDKVLNYNTLASTWHETHSIIRDLTGHYAAKRKIELGLEYCEAKRIDLALSWVFEPDVEKPTATHGGICPVLKHLCSWIGELGDRVNVFMADAMALSKILGERIIDVINVDPPYLSQHTYSDLSEFFWQILRIALAPAIKAGYIFSRGNSGAELFVAGWDPTFSRVPRDSELIERKTAKTQVKGKCDLKIKERMKILHSREWYIKGMYIFFREAYRTLKDDGILIVWFTHSDPEAWESILSALYTSGFIVTKVWTIITEMAERRVALAGSAFFSSLAIVARKAGDRVIVGSENFRDLLVNEEVKNAIVSSTVDALQSANESRALEHEKYIMAIAGAIAGATRIWNPTLEVMPAKCTVGASEEFVRVENMEVDDTDKLVRILRFFRESLYPVALYHGISRILEGTVKETFTNAGLEKTLVDKMTNDMLLVDNNSKAYLLLWMSTRFSEESNIEYDFGEKICKVLGTNLRELKWLGLLETKGGESTYKIVYGKQVLDLVKRRVEVLDKTNVGMALRLTHVLATYPVSEELNNVAEHIKATFPISKRVIAVALFLLLTAKQEELESFGIKLNKSFIKDVLKLLYER